jgi:hypothetical protein
MKIASVLTDGRISAKNYLIEIPIGEYIDISKKLLKNNEFQRKKVSNSNTIYSLLKADIVLGCVIPPIVLALSSEEVTSLNDDSLKDTLEANVSNLMILDGLQRTHSLIDIESEFIEKGDKDKLVAYRLLPIRCEIYLGINRIGILYRMLTLNTGQTPMSLRQQIEMLYHDYLKIEIDGVTLTREVDQTKAKNISSYNFKEVVEGFNCYLERNELPIERVDLLENIKSLEKLSLENSSTDLFRDYVSTYNKLMLMVNYLTKDANIEPDISEEDDGRAKEGGSVWGKTGSQLFKKQQALAGFGAAVGKLKDHGIIIGFTQIERIIDKLTIGADPLDFIVHFNKSMKWIADNSKKIGNGQRMFFQYYFREVFNSESDCYLTLHSAVSVALQRYKSQIL